MSENALPLGKVGGINYRRGGGICNVQRKSGLGWANKGENEKKKQLSHASGDIPLHY